MEDWTRYEPKFRYMMLSRMKQDCDYYLRIKAGSPFLAVLWPLLILILGVVKLFTWVEDLATKIKEKNDV